MRRYSSTSSLAGLLGLLLPLYAFAGELPLRAFTASYNLYQGGMHIAHAELSLRREGNAWHWRMTTQPRSIYKLFIRRRPINETRFVATANGFRLQQISVVDESRPGRHESATFDWNRGQVKILRKGKQHELPLESEVYDYQSIHLLAAVMARNGIDGRQIDFYRKGKLVDSNIRRSGSGHVRVLGERLEANIFEQVTARSNSKIKYYYDAANPILPLRIERLDAGESASLMTLQRVEWKL